MHSAIIARKGGPEVIAVEERPVPEPGEGQVRIRVARNAQWQGNADYAIADASRIEQVPEAFDWKLAASYSTCAYTAWLLIHSAGIVYPVPGEFGRMETIEIDGLFYQSVK